MNVRLWSGMCALLSLSVGAQSAQFSEEERARLVKFWNEPGRYSFKLAPGAAEKGTFQVRLTVDGSRWFLAYQKAVGAAKLPPTQDAIATSPDTKVWEDWVKAKLAYDRAVATANAAQLNGKPILQEPVSHPGPIPASLAKAAGNPPSFANVVAPRLYTVRFEDDETFEYPDHVALRERYAYYRFTEGTVAYGPRLKEMPRAELEELFSAAGFSPSEVRIAMVVSKLEGGFETVNTYDTGYVSIGFIQFITFDTGKHSLMRVMEQEKRDDPEAYARDFLRYGMDVNDEGAVVVIDPSTGAELSGPAAVLRIIEDKRLTAIYQRAGRRRAFRIAQIKTAKTQYWPADDVVEVKLVDRVVSARVREIIKSEAGMATLFDRKVNRGSIDPLAEVLAKVMATHNLERLGQAADYEREIVEQLKYREDFLKDKELGQPK